LRATLVLILSGCLAAAAPAAHPDDWEALSLRVKPFAVKDLEGRTLKLADLSGKIAVIDFWATWCKPCGVLDRELAELARRHPGEIAVRKLNVVDGDSPASRKYLGDATLPHIKVFGRDGRLRWERSAPPRTLASEVEKLVTGER